MRVVSMACAAVLVLALTGCDDKEAARIKEETEAQLAALSKQQQLSGGAVTVKSEGDEYRVAIADVVLTPSPDVRMPLGEVTYLYEPVDDQTVRYADIRVASPIEIQSAEGEPKARLSFESDNVEGIWSIPLENFISLDASLPTIRIESLEDATVILLTNTTMTSDTADPSAARTDQTGALTIETIDVTGVDNDRVIIDGVTAQSRLVNADLAAMATASNTLETASTTGENLAPAIVALLNSFSGSDTTLTMDRIVHVDPAGTEYFSLTNLRVVGTMNDADKELGTMNLAFGYDSIALPAEATADPTMELVTPQVLAFNIDFAHVPFRKAATQLAAIAPSMQEMGQDQPEIAGLMLMSALRAAFSEAGTTIRLDGTRIQLRDALVTVAGGVNVDPNAPFGVVGAMDVSIFGLDALTAAAQELPQTPENQEFLGTLEFLAVMSDRGQDGGETVDRYRIEADAYGAVTVNGQQMF